VWGAGGGPRPAPTWVRDLACGGRPTLLTWHKRIWRCAEPLCQAGTWTKTSEAIRARSVLTERARVQACRRVGQDATDVAAVAADLGVGWATVMRAVVEYGTQILDAAAQGRLVRMLGVDETAFLKATPTSPTRFATGLLDLRPAGGGPARLLDIVEGRSGRVLSDWIDARRLRGRGAHAPTAVSPSADGPPPVWRWASSPAGPCRCAGVATDAASGWPGSPSSVSVPAARMNCGCSDWRNWLRPGRCRPRRLTSA